MDETKPPTDDRNFPADRKLIDQQPELQDPSTRGKVASGAPAPAGSAPAPGTTPGPAAAPASPERPPVAQGAQIPPGTAGSVPNDSRGQPRPHGPGGSDAEKNATGDARKMEQEQRAAQDAEPDQPEGAGTPPSAQQKRAAGAKPQP